MEAPSLWLFLFIALSIGWLLGRFESKKSGSRTKAPLASSQVKTRLQLLFDSYSDSAIDSMLQNLEVTPETFTTHVSIGKHFRKQGEVEKAILVHQNLMAHPELTQSNSDIVILELAKDYKAAGLFDRAVSLLEQLMGSKTHQYEANVLMLDIKEKEKDWNSAVIHAQQIDFKKYPEIRTKLSHYLCEQAEEKLKDSLVRDSELRYKQALQVSKQCVRAMLGLAEIEIFRKEYGQAIRYLKQVPELSPEDTSLVFPLLLKCTVETSSFNQYIAYLEMLGEKTGQVAVVIALAEAIREEKGKASAIDYIKARIKESPKISLLRYLLTLSEDDDWGAEELANQLGVIVSKIASERNKFKCSSCGFESSHLMWQCPSCKSWQTTKPVLEYSK